MRRNWKKIATWTGRTKKRGIEICTESRIMLRKTVLDKMGEVIDFLGTDLEPRNINPNEDIIGKKARRVRLPGHRSRSASQDEFLNEVVRKPRYNREMHSSFFLSVSNLGDAAYECSCGFLGQFKSKKCARCGLKL